MPDDEKTRLLILIRDLVAMIDPRRMGRLTHTESERLTEANRALFDAKLHPWQTIPSDYR